MAGKKKKTGAPEDETPTALELTIKREHLAFPHSIELRRNGGDHVVEARLEDHRHTETLGAKTVEAILIENGAALPETADEALVITFSPYNGEIMTITPNKKSVAAVETETDQGDEKSSPN